MNGTGKWSVRNSNIVCPENKHCNITVNGRKALVASTINGTLGSKLFILASGERVMMNSIIYCPPDYEPGPKYSNHGLCNIYNDGVAGMNVVTIHANEGFNNINIKCETNPCYYEGEEPVLLCGDSFEGGCILEMDLNSNDLFCSDPTNICNNFLPSPFPRTSPSMLYFKSYFVMILLPI